VLSGVVDLPVGPLVSFICSVTRDSSLEFSSLLSWLARRYRPVLSSSIVVNQKLVDYLSSTIALKDRGFVSVSSSLSSWTIEMKAEDETACAVSWILLYRASVSGYKAADFHRACDGMGSCAVVVKADNGRIAVAYNEDGFASGYSRIPNLNGFIASVEGDVRCGEIFHQNDREYGVYNFPGFGPDFGTESGTDLHISSNCQENEDSRSVLGVSYGGPGVDRYALLGQENFRVVDYEVFKIVIDFICTFDHP
jgi:hypothetical protein